MKGKRFLPISLVKNLKLEFSDLFFKPFILSLLFQSHTQAFRRLSMDPSHYIFIVTLS